jgi:hypothetical protein
MNSNIIGTNRSITVIASATLLTLFLLPVGSHAANVTVGCPGAAGGPFTYPSFGAALSAVPLTNTTITISGTCTEADVIAGAQNLQIIGTPGAALVDPGGNPPNFGAVLEIDNSQGVVLQGLTIRVASRSVDTAIPVILVQASNVDVVQCRLEGAGASDGIDMFQSTVRLFGDTVIENNNDGLGDGEGVFLQGPNALLVLRSDPSGCPLIQGNGDAGINASGGGATVRAPLGPGCATIQNNGAYGITASLGVTIVLNAPQANPGSVKLLNNGIDGLVVVNGAHFNLNGPVLIQGSPEDGIRLRNAFGVLTVSDGAAGPIIQQNGTSLNPPCCAPAAGISLGNNASVDLLAGQVTNNSGPGVIAQDNSSVRLIGPISITHNPIGVEVTDASSAALFLAPNISGNPVWDVVCGPESVAHGDNSTVGRSNCPQFRHEANPVALPKQHGKPDTMTIPD